MQQKYLCFNTQYLLQKDFIATMSVKDRIAMWNNIASNNSNTNSPVPKVTASTFAPKPQPQQQEPIRASENLTHKHQVDTVTIVKPSDLKKKAQMEQGLPGNKTPEFLIKPTQPANRPPEPIKRETSNSNSNHQASIESPTIPKPSDIKKQFQQQISGNNFHFVAPVQVKKVQSITIEPRQESTSNVTYEIEKETPVVNVKQSAEKLGLFYQKKNEQLTKPKEIVPVPQVHEVHEQKPKQQQAPHPQLPQQDVYVPPEEDKFILPPQNEPLPPAPTHQPAPQATEPKEQTEELDMAVRLKNRNKKRRVNFDSDED